MVDLKQWNYGNALIHRARNAALAKARSDADYVAFVDDDMMPHPDALLRLVKHQVPVVSALCTTKVPPVEIAAKVYHRESDQFVPFERVRLDRLLSGDFAIGAAFLVINRPTIDLLMEHYLSAGDWREDNRRTFDRLHVRSAERASEQKRRAEIRRANFARERYLNVFGFALGENEMEMGEDISFSRRLMQLKVPVAIDTAVQVGHVGEYPYSIWDALQREEYQQEALCSRA